MICPKCRVALDIRGGSCVNCGFRSDMETLPGKEPSYRKLVEVYATWKNIEACFLKSFLDSCGVDSYIHNLYYPSMTPVGTGAVPIRIMVPEDDRENRRRAEEIIKEYLENQ